MTTEPIDVRWNGRPVALSPIEGALLALLIRRTRLTWDEANALLTDYGCCVDSRDVLIHRVRRKFADVGAADPVETVRGWGIRFRTEADLGGSSAFWIGGSAAEPLPA